MDNKKLLYIVIGLILYIISTVSTYAFFSSGAKQQVAQQATVAQPTKSADGSLSFGAGPKTQPCPLNGVLYTQAQEKWWEGHRPLAVMIENEIDARPQSGISFADVTYEAIAEAGITRTMNVFYCQDAGIIGPVRSARTYFLDYASEYGNYPLYAHVGGANTPGPADALGQIDDYGWGGYNDMNQFAIGFPVYQRDESRQGHPVATEHTMYSTTTKLWDYAKANRNLTNVDKTGQAWDTDFVKYSFKNDAPASSPTASSITVPFTGDSDYVVQWTYDKATNAYVRDNGGMPHIDRDTNKQLSVKDIIVLFETRQSADDGYENDLHNLYGTIGSGKAEIFMDGTEIRGTWKKTSRTARTQIFDASGNEVQFDRGHMWFEIATIGDVITVK